MARRKQAEHRTSPFGGKAMCGSTEGTRGFGVSQCDKCEEIYQRQKERNRKTAATRRKNQRAYDQGRGTLP